MHARARLLIVLTLVGVGGWYGWHWMFPGDEAEIAAVLERIAASVDAEEGEGAISTLSRAAQVGRELAPDVSVDAGPPFQRVTGRESIVAAAARARATVQELEIHFPDMEIDIAPDRQTATALVVAEARFVARGEERSLEARELEIGFTRHEGDWVVATVSLVRPLQRLDGR
jgi:hypothetical protein